MWSVGDEPLHFYWHWTSFVFPEKIKKFFNEINDNLVLGGHHVTRCTPKIRMCDNVNIVLKL